MAQSDPNEQWLDQFVVKNNDAEESPSKDIDPSEDKSTRNRDDERRLEELRRMQKQASSGAFAGVASNLNGIDEEKYLEMCKLWESEIKFTCSAPEGWREAYAEHMRARAAKFGTGDADSIIKPVGKKRLF